MAANTTKSTLVQGRSLIKKYSLEDSEKILKEEYILPSEIGAEAMVAMKLDMGIPWEKLKTMAR